MEIKEQQEDISEEDSAPPGELKVFVTWLDQCLGVGRGANNG